MGLYSSCLASVNCFRNILIQSPIYNYFKAVWRQPQFIRNIGIIFISDNGGYRLNILVDLRYNSINIDTAGKIDALVIPVPIFFICLSSPSSIYSSRIRAACDSIQRIDYRCYRASIDIIISSTFYRLHRKQQGAIVSYSAIGNCCILKS